MMSDAQKETVTEFFVDFLSDICPNDTLEVTADYFADIVEGAYNALSVMRNVLGG